MNDTVRIALERALGDAQREYTEAKEWLARTRDEMTSLVARHETAAQRVSDLRTALYGESQTR